MMFCYRLWRGAATGGINNRLGVPLDCDPGLPRLMKKSFLKNMGRYPRYAAGQAPWSRLHYVLAGRQIYLFFKTIG